MNNYCTNCGEKIEKGELVCKNCNTPIVDLPYDYVYRSPEKKEIQKKRLNILVRFFLCFFVFCLIIVIINTIKVNKLQKEYVEPFLKQNYSDIDYSIEYESSGKCIIYGDCYFDPVMGCDGGACEEYRYLDRNECKSYYYSVKTGNDEFKVTVYYKDKVYSVVEGKNINGTDYEEDMDYDDSIYDSKENDNINNKDNKYDGNVVIDKYPYESDYYTFSSTYKNNQIFLDNNGTNISFFTGVLDDNSELYISGSIANPMVLKGSVHMNAKYYDENYNEIGFCNDIIPMLGEGNSNSAFSCHISESELMPDEKIKDVAYYKVYILSIEKDG